MSVSLVTAGVLAFLLGVAHSVLGERYIIVRVLRRPLPPLFGDDTFTRRTLRFAWHLTSLAWLAAGGLFAVYAHVGVDDGARVALRALAVLFAASAVVTFAASRARHLAWIVMGAIAALAWVAAGV